MNKNVINVFDQKSFDCRLDWGLNGIKRAVKRKDIIVIIDVLSFSTTVITAIHYGAEIFPFIKSNIKDIDLYAQKINAEVVLGRSEAKLYKRQSLSPLSFDKSCNKKKFLLPSRNGSTYSKIAENNKYVFIGSIINASSVSSTINKIRKFNKIPVTVISCGERWKEDKELRPSIEDYLGAGAILSTLNGIKSPEAKVCINAFKTSKPELKKLIWNSISGRELRSWGFDKDVRYASKLNMIKEVPFLKNKSFKLYK